MKVRAGGGYYDEKLGKMVIEPECEVEVPDDWMQQCFAAMKAAEEPTHILVAPEVIEILKQSLK